MTATFRRITAGAVLLAAPVIVALGTATAGHAQTGTHTDPGPSISQPQQHKAFPAQDFSGVTPGSSAHHHHQWHRAG